MEYQETFENRNNIQGLVMDTLNELRNEINHHQNSENNSRMIDALSEYLNSYVEVSNYLIEELLKEITMAEARVMELERDQLRA
jgi:hypothetical protein